jgi:hypothetical protein
MGKARTVVLRGLDRSRQSLLSHDKASDVRGIWPVSLQLSSRYEERSRG